MQPNFTLTINGTATEGKAGQFDVINPANESIIAKAPLASVDQLHQAVAAAKQAFTSWSKTTHQERQAFLATLADVIESNADAIARLITQEQGKPLFLAEIEVQAAAGWTRYTARLEVPSKVIEDSDTRHVVQHHLPLGVVGSITPWNWPIMIAIWHIMPALRAGNTVVCKPSGLTPLSTLLLIEKIAEVLPKGVINVVTGEAEVGNAMSQHPDIAKLIFTGSTQTGQRIVENSAGNLKRLTLELGGNDAGIVLDDADPKAMAEAIFKTAFINMGQTCACLKRLFVHESIADELTQELIRIANAQTVGDGLEANTTFGPVQNQVQFDKVVELIDDAKSNGGLVVCGGEALGQKGYFIPPTLIRNVGPGVRLVDEEQFGPVLPIITYKNLDEAVQMANAVGEGLGGSVWSTNIERAQEVAQRLVCGTTWVNNHGEVLPHIPFGGCKLSGFGVEFAEEGLLECTRIHIINTTK
jgi:acyl-CoA reductase-like NAD-dependent aldehyde dehydrogenase